MAPSLLRPSSAPASPATCTAQLAVGHARAVLLSAHLDCTARHLLWTVQQRAPHNAVVAQSVVAIVTRAGNPKQVRGWDDLIRYILRPIHATHGPCCAIVVRAGTPEQACGWDSIIQ